MPWLIWGLTLLWLCYLLWENRCAAKARGRLAHVVHVNGIRGKSTVGDRKSTRLNSSHAL